MRSKTGAYYQTVGLIVLGIGILTLLGIFGSFNPTPGCSGVLGFFTNFLGLCYAFNQPIGLVLIVVGVVLYYMGVKR